MEHVEDKFTKLISAGNKENRTKWATEWQQQGKKVIGVLDSLVPEEVIYAAGMLPWRIQGTWQADVSRAMRYRLPQGNTFLNHVLESLLEGELDFLDGMVCSDRDEDFIRFWDYWDYLSQTRLVYQVQVPILDSELTRQRFTSKIREFLDVIEKFGKVKVSDSSLRDAIAVYDKGRALLRKVYELRKREEPPITGGEALAITMAAMVMPRDEFNQELEALLPYLETRKAKVSRTKPRLLLSGDLLDNPAYIDLVEAAGCLVAMDDMDTGSRYFWEEVDGGSDLAQALAVRYLKNRSPRMLDWRGQIEQLVKWAKEFNIDGVLELPDTYDYTRGFRRPVLEKQLKEADIPLMSFERDYYLSNVGQLKTRIGAFLEILG
ncbi:MAG: 2-hydroxyacyl-CoA dehydratase family protein [Dehalococcoidia bacterium]|jgi:benzoyl-CoA reductase/2-hydroxyglutaryl-CoA dehydratase subunit BcrC/BadD/HgdB